MAHSQKKNEQKYQTSLAYTVSTDFVLLQFDKWFLSPHG